MLTHTSGLKFSGIHELRLPSDKQGITVLAICKGTHQIGGGSEITLQTKDKKWVPGGDNCIFVEPFRAADYLNISQTRLARMGTSLDDVMQRKLNQSAFQAVSPSSCLPVVSKTEDGRDFPDGRIVRKADEIEQIQLGATVEPKDIIAFLTTDHVDIAQANAQATLKQLKAYVPFPLKENETYWGIKNGSLNPDQEPIVAPE